MKSQNFFFHALCVGVFLLGITTPIIENIFHGSDLSSSENRRLTDLPQITSDSLKDYPIKFENFFNDHFGFRSQLVYLNGLLKVFLLKESPLKKLLFGQEGWVYYVSEEAGDGYTINDYMGLVPYTVEELNLIKQNVQLDVTQLEQMHINLIYMMTPNKPSIYPDYLPGWVASNKGFTRFDQLKDSISNTGIKLIDLRESLREGRDRGDVYFKYGTHWNEYGAWIAYRELLNKLKIDHRWIVPLSEFEIKIVDGKSIDNGYSWLNLVDYFYNPETKLFIKPEGIERVVNFQKMKKLILFHDSFGNPNGHGKLIVDLLKNYFEEVECITHDWKPIPIDVVKAKKPSHVILEFTERYQYLFTKARTQEI